MNDNQRLSAVVSVVLMLATATLGWFAWSSRLTPARPPEGRSAALVPPSEQDVVARLWEDPLQAVQAEFAGGGKNEGVHMHSTTGLAQVVSRHAAQAKVLLLVIPIPGTPFPDDIETRLRLRYALQMAMAQRGRYTPEDRDHLGYFQLGWATADGFHIGTNQGREFRSDFHREAPVAYEWFTPRPGEGRPVTLVLWLPEELLGAESLCTLGFLRDRIAPTNSAGGSNLAGLFVVGPRSSDALKRIASTNTAFSTFRQGDHCCVELLREKLRFYSPQATAPDALLDLKPSPEWGKARQDLDASIGRQLGRTNGTWYYAQNLIAPDDQLTDLLVRELAQRGISLGPGNTNMLILAEADTSYGRSLPRALEASLWSRQIDAILELPPSTTTAVDLRWSAVAPHYESLHDTKVTIVRYLQGLDLAKGRKETEGPGRKAAARTAEEALAEALTAEATLAQGESQLDYAERLAQNIKNNPGADRIRAVGVLGGDVHDKLILLRAMHLTFPDALFFTTDLDARLWHPNHLPYTRNLIVASAYGIELENAQNSNTLDQIPAFRDVYQVAVFKACLAALEDAAAAPLQTNAAPHARSSPVPKLFEVGRHGPVELVCFRDPKKPSPTARQMFGLLFKAPSRAGVILLSLGLVGAVLVWHFSGGPQQHRQGTPAAGEMRSRGWDWRWRALWTRRSGWFAPFSLATGALLAALYVAGQVISREAGGEPWAWLAGVSAWPTEMMRVFIIAVIAWTFCFMWQAHLRNRARLQRDYFTSPSPPEAPAAGPSESYAQATLAPALQLRAFQPLLGRWQALRNTWNQIVEPWPSPTPRAAEDSAEAIPAAQRISAQEVFAAYVRKAGGGPRFLRVLVGTAIYLAFGVGLMLVIGMPSSVNVRGASTRLIDLALLTLSVIGFCALVFYVLDSVWLSAQLLDRIAGPVTVWPSGVRSAPQKILHVEEDDLEGWLDVGFAGEKTQDTGRLIFLPFLVQFLMLLARNSLFDNWSWPAGLIFIFVCNVVLASAGWLVLRRAARAVRQSALQKLGDRLLDLGQQLITAKDPTKAELQQRQAGLLELKRGIEAEQRGAYARVIQDPALLAVLIPTGLLGILAVLLRTLFGIL